LASSPTPSSSQRTARNGKSVAKDIVEEKDDILEDELLGGDAFFAESAVDSRNVEKPLGSDSDSDEENPDEIRLRQGKAYLSKVMRKSEQDSSDDDSEGKMDVDAITARLAEDAVCYPSSFVGPHSLNID
jgi:hypothetical protein